MRIHRCLILWIFFFTLLGCSPSKLRSYSEEWVYTDLRAFDPVDTNKPSHDLLAIYSRYLNKGFQLRLDFLEITHISDADIYVAIDYQPGGKKSLPISIQAEIDWDLLLKIPANGEIIVTNHDYLQVQEMAVSVFRNPELDSIEIDFRLPTSIENPFFRRHAGVSNMQIFVTAADSKQVIDKTLHFRTDATAPSPARIIFTFWDCFPAYNPASTLRRWDGAHTGPFGGRHGLYNLLRTARSHQIPLFLLDLRSPYSLSALEYFGGMGLIRELITSGLITLAQSMPDQANSPYLVDNRQLDKIIREDIQLSKQYSLPLSTFAYSPNGDIVNTPQFNIIFSKFALNNTTVLNSTLSAQVYRYRDKKIIPLPPGIHKSTDFEQATPNGPSIELKKALILNALKNNNLKQTEKGLLILGGSLPASAWGDPISARQTFSYLNSHPWIKVLNAHDLQISEPQQSLPIPPNISIDLGNQVPDIPDLDKLEEELLIIPSNSISSAAWQTFRSLNNPIFPFSPKLPQLRKSYLSNVWALLFAAQWTENPKPYHSCEIDADHDAEMECIIANLDVLAILEPKGSRLAFLFIRTTDGVHQAIGPSSQLITGMSDPSFWQSQDGHFIDPNVINGAFDTPEFKFENSSSQDGIIFTSASGMLIKSYHLIPGGLSINIETKNDIPLRYSIPLLVDPWYRFNPGWSDQYIESGNGTTYTWGIKDEFRVQIGSSGKLSAHPFTASRQFFSATENPNQDYPTSHFLPFPINLVEISSIGELFVELTGR